MSRLRSLATLSGLPLFDRVALLASVAVAAWLRLPGIEARGRFDADQGHDMLTLLAFTRDGVVPLLGPKTSAGEFHHGAFYYYLLAPSAAVSGSDPVVVTIFLALLGIGAVALTWWLGRAIGGSMAGAIAGLLMAASPAAIEASTFIWNPNPIAFFAALAFAAAWRARSGGRRAWWALALLAAGMVVQLHILGAIFFLAVLAIVALQAWRDRSVVRPLVLGLAGVALLFVPLLAWELQSGFAETRGVLAYLAEGGGGVEVNPLVALAFTLYRVVGWPLVGAVLEAPAAAAVLLALVIGGAALSLRLVPPPRRAAVRWFVGLLVWSTLALSVAAPSLLQIVIGLPNDHYHSFLDPVVILLIAIPAGMLFDRTVAAWRSTRRPAAGLAAAAVALVVVAVSTTAMVRRPPKVDPDGGWPAMRDAGARVLSNAGSTIALVGLPPFKSADAMAFPIVRAGGEVLSIDPPAVVPAPTDPIVVACDRLFEGVMSLPCGGPAETIVVTTLEGGGLGPYRLVDRFDVAPFSRTSISIYVPVAGQ